MFIPLTKADAAQRLVYGYIDETPDRAREVMDYATAKPAFQSWSEDLSKASGGKNLGNVRAQHDMKKAAGCLRAIDFDDAQKRIEFCAHIVDDQEWAKVEAGVYTGFSPGGSYAKRWADGQYHRYTPKVGELSIVDCPCIPTGTFTMVKTDGSEAEVEFVLDKAYEPGNEATKARAEEMAKAAGAGTFKDHVVQARADLILENASEALAKMASADDVAVGAPDQTGSGEPSSDGGTTFIEPDRLAVLDAALAKADEALAPVVSGDALTTGLDVYAAAFTGALAKSDVDLYVNPPSPEAVALIGADINASLAALGAIRTAAEPMLAKGLYALSDALASLQSFSWITQDVIWEAAMESDGSSLPQQAVNIVNALKAFVIAMIEEEVAEMLARAQVEAAGDVEFIIDASTDGSYSMELANKIVDLVKADEPRMAKAGARNSAADATRIQAIHDKSCELGAGCSDGGAAEKAASLTADNERLAKAVDGALPRLEALTEEIGALRERDAARDAEMVKMRGEIEQLGNQPAPSKIALAISKEEDSGLAKADEPAPGSLDEIAAMPAGPARYAALEKHAQRLANQTPA